MKRSEGFGGYERSLELMKELPKARGTKELRKHLQGERLTTRQMVLAKCCDCLGYYIDGKMDCQIPACPLYPLMPYQKNQSYKVKSVSDSQRKKFTQRMKRLSKVSEMDEEEEVVDIPQSK